MYVRQGNSQDDESNRYKQAKLYRYDVGKLWIQCKIMNEDEMLNRVSIEMYRYIEILSINNDFYFSNKLYLIRW